MQIFEESGVEAKPDSMLPANLPSMTLKPGEYGTVTLPKPASKEEERAKFEKWGNAKGAHIEQSWTGEFYNNKLVESAWQGWQACLESRAGKS